MEDHEEMSRHFDEWISDSHTHWISEQDAAYQGFMAAWETQSERYMDADDIAQAVRWHLRRNFISLKAAAEHYEVSTAYLSAVQCGERPAPNWLLEKLGRRRQTMYVKA